MAGWWRLYPVDEIHRRLNWSTAPGPAIVPMSRATWREALEAGRTTNRRERLPLDVYLIYFMRSALERRDSGPAR